MRVALIGRYRVPFPYDLQDVDHPMMMRWARELGRLDIFVLPRDHAEAHWSDGPLHVHYAPRAVISGRHPAFLVWASRTVARLDRDERFDLLNGSDLWGGLVGVWLKRRLGRPLLAQMQGEFFPPDPTYYGRFGSRVLHRVARIVCAHADMIRCLYTDSARRIVESGCATWDRLGVVPSRCDVRLFSPTAAERTSAETVLFVGNLVRGKGVDELLEAFVRVLERRPAARLAIVGDGPRRDELAASAVRLGVSGRVVFHGRLPHRSLPALMRAARLLVLPSHSEGTPRVVLEAMAMELPIVATSVGGVPEIVDDDRTGLLVDPGDVGALSAAIARVLDDPDWARRAGIAGRQIVTSRYGIDSHVAKMVEMQLACAHRIGPGVVERDRVVSAGLTA